MSWSRFFRRKQWDTERAQELSAYLETETADNIQRGMSPEEAKRVAHLKLGNVARIREEIYKMNSLGFLETTLQDIRYALRGFRRAPAFALTVILAIALGIGATTGVFSVVDRILFRSLPYRHADQLVTFGYVAPIEPNEFLTSPDFAEWGNAHGAFSSTASFNFVRDCDITQAPAARLQCAHVEWTFLPTFGIQPLLGRNFTREEDSPAGSAGPSGPDWAGGGKVALLSYGLWKSRFGADQHIVGKTISLDDQQTTIIGVLPRDFELPTLGEADMLVPEAFPATAFVHSINRPTAILRAFARLAPGVTIAQAKAALQPAFPESLKWVPPGFRNEVSLSVRTLRDRQIEDARLASWVLFGAVLAVLLIACANVANLLLARSTARQREFAIRAALGAAPARLLLQTLTESVALALAGGALGCGFAYALIKIFVAISPHGIVHLSDATLDLRVLAFTLLVSVISGLAFGFASAQRHASNDALYGRASFGFSRAFFRRALVSAQIAISFVLLVGAGLLIRSLDNLERVPLGMDTSGVITATIALNPRLYTDMSRRQHFFDAIEQRLRQLPGVSAFALTDSAPLLPGGSAASIYANIEVSGRPRTPQGTGGMVGYSTVTPEFFSALGIPIVNGHAFTEADRSPNANVAILNAVLAKRLFPNGDAVGKQVRFGPDGAWCTIVGVAGGVKYVQNNGFISTAESEYYLPLHHSQSFVDSEQKIILRTSLGPAAVASWMRSTVGSLDPTVPVTVDSMSERMSQLEARPRFNAALLGIFAALGILLAALGTYGVLAFLVVQRTREIGVRMALGAHPYHVQKMILAQGAMLALAGLVFGVAGAFALTRLMKSLLFGVTPADPAIFVGVAVFLLLVALAACYLPARRAMRVDPLVALRYE
ncbi:MAG TPA: ABC transporter permease [Candidatus Acidoferrales bacterium]|nr:ABC transporter permease [Candidatus Acidoferrales bacterium]